MANRASVVIDGDAHINESLEVFDDFLEEQYRARRPQLIKDTLGLTRILLEGRLYPDPRLTQAHTEKVEGTNLGGKRKDPAGRLGDLDLDGIDVQVMYGSLGLALSTIRDADFRAAMSRACNDYYAHFCSTAPDRLKCMATLPLPEVPASVEEMRRACTELGHAGVTVPPNVNGKDLDHPDFAPIFQTAQELNVPVTVHWGNGSYLQAAGTERFDTHFMVHAVGHPFEQMLALASIVCGGVLEEFPDVRVAFLEAGCGWVPYWVERLDEHYERRSREMPRMTKEASDYIRDGNVFFSAEPDERLVPAVVDMLGDDCIFYASDYPHTDSKWPNSVKCVRERDDISDETKAKLLGGNAVRYYGFDPSTLGSQTG